MTDPTVSIFLPAQRARELAFAALEGVKHPMYGRKDPVEADAQSLLHRADAAERAMNGEPE